MVKKKKNQEKKEYTLQRIGTGWDHCTVGVDTAKEGGR